MLKLNPKTHAYTFNGVDVPGITTVLKTAGISNYDEVDAEVLKRAASFGLAVHLACALDDRDNLGECDEVIIPYLNGWRKFKKDTGIKMLVIEEPLYSKKYGFAGTPDRLGHVKDSPHIIPEIKTGQHEYWHELQTAGQELLFRDNFSLKRYVHWTVNLVPDNYKINPVDPSRVELNKKTFLACLQVYHWKQSIKKEREQ